MKRVPISKVAEFINGRAFKPEEWELEGLPIIRIQNLTGSTDITNYHSGEVEPKYLVKDGDILISWSASLGVYIWEGGDAILNQHIFKVAIKEDVVDKMYFYYAAHNALNAMIAQVHGATMQHITRDPFLAIEIPLPPLPEQRRIADLLSRADRLRRLRRLGDTLSASLLQSVFLEMFGGGNWERTTLGKVCSLIRDGTHITPTYVPTGIPFVTVKNIVSGHIDFSDTKFISQEEHKKISKVVKPERGDILVSKDGTIGIPCPVDADKDFSIFVSVALLKPFRKVVNTNFLSYQISSKSVQDQIADSIKGIAIRHLHLEDFKRLEVIIPPLLLQEQFAAVVRWVESLRARQSESARQVECLFQGLLSQSFGGSVQ